MKGIGTIAVAASAAALVAVGVLGVSRADEPAPPPQCYQKLLYRICVGEDGQWHADPIPALPMPGPPPAPPPAPGGPG
jgi:hypothetical protein